MDNAFNMFMYVLGIGLVLAIVVFCFVVMWRFYEKGGKPGWASLIPIYNLFALNQMAGRPGWWIILYFIPLVNIAVSLIVAIDLAKAFGKSTAFGIVGLFLFSLFGYAIVAFSDVTYTQPVRA